MFKRCSDRQKTAPPVGMHFAQPEPDTPLNTDAKARLSRASDSTQTAEVSPSNVQVNPGIRAICPQALSLIGRTASGRKRSYKWILLILLTERVGCCSTLSGRTA